MASENNNKHDLYKDFGNVYLKSEQKVIEKRENFSNLYFIKILEKNYFNGIS